LSELLLFSLDQLKLRRTFGGRCWLLPLLAGCKFLPKPLLFSLDLFPCQLLSRGP
jgi:hypothetical protein